MLPLDASRKRELKYFTWTVTAFTSLLNSRQLKFCLSAVGIFGFLAFESSREALKDRSEDEVRHTD
jgi:hypothetical protein